MIDANVIARSHFTKQSDGESSYYQFLRTVGLQSEGLPFRFDGTTDKHGKNTRFTAASWGGYVNADNEWVVFVSWRNNALKETKVIHWTWDSENKCCFNRRDWGFRS